MAAAASASWENWAEPWEHLAPASWEDEVEEDPAQMSAEACGLQLRDLLIDLKLCGKLNATQVCTLAFWAARAGAAGPCHELAVKPGSRSGAYSAHFDKVTLAGPSSIDFYDVPLARRLKGDLGRRWEPVPLVPPHECLMEELLVSDEAEVGYQQAVDDDQLPLLYNEHKAVISARAAGMAPPRPFVLYMDGVQFTRRETVLGVWVSWLYSSKRNLVFVLRKGDSCNCGCNGWCSLYPMFLALRWSFVSLLQGSHPTARHDGSAWLDSDAGRSSFAGEQLGGKGVCLFVKGDWAELVQRWGFFSWQSNSNPCPHCFTSAEQLYTTRGFSPLRMPCAEKTIAHYQAACAACETSVVLDRPLLREVRNALQFSKGKGRHLVCDIPAAGLLKNDQLRPSAEQPDIGHIDLEAGPRQCIFWRAAEQTLAKVRNPLISEECGLSLRSFAIDWLHCLSMGVFQHYLGHLVCELIEGDLLDFVPARGMKSEQCCVRIMALLKNWYRSERKQGRPHSEVQALVKGMLRQSGQPFLGLHAAETNGFLRFAQQVLLPQFGGGLGARCGPYTDAATALVEILDICYRRDGKPKGAVIRQFTNSSAALFRSLQKLELRFKPKHHQLLELGARLL